MSNQWTITEDFINKSYIGSELGTTSAIFDGRKDMPVRFELYDDDKNLYFKGVMEEEDFTPMDDFGFSYGCTGIKTSLNLSKMEWL